MIPFFKRFLCLLLAATLLFLSGCNTSSQSDDTTNPASDTIEPAPSILNLIVDKKLSYKIIRPEYGGNLEIEAAKMLRDAFRPITDVYPSMTDDWENKDDNASIFEILVGKTNRPESSQVLATLNKNSYAIRVVANKLVIVGTTSEMTLKAVQAFIGAYIEGESEPGVIPASLNYVGTATPSFIDKTDSTIEYIPVSIEIPTNRFGLDADYIIKNTATAIDSIRFCDGSAELIYCIDTTGKLEAKITLNMNQEFTIEVSESRNGPWTNVKTMSAGSTLVDVAITPYDYGIFTKTYIRLTDPTTQNGGGAAIHSITVHYYEEAPISSHPYALDEETKNAIKQLNLMLEKVEVDGFAIHADGGMIYDPISREKAGQLFKYNGAEAFTGTLTLGSKTISYSIPKQVTAYDAVPLTYTLTTKTPITSATPFHISVTGYEDATRENGNTYYDLNLPGTVDIAFEYDGYVNGTTGPAGFATINPTNNTSTVAASYPNYTVGDLTRSGTVAPADITWFKFTYTNVGNTVLDYDGNGTFAFEPKLYKKVGNEWQEYSGTQNGFYVLQNELYPGESQSLWINFVNAPTQGEYKIVINGLIRNEIANPENYGRTIFHGNLCTSSSMEFTVGNGGITEPEPIKEYYNATERNHWLHYYEEFQSSYVTFRSHTGTITDTVYVQLSPWCNQVVLKIMDGNLSNMVAVSIPIEVESDSLSITLDPDNPNYVVLEDGTRFPAIMTQSMADMRINDSQSPYMAEDIVRYLCEMKDLGINVINTTAGLIFTYANGNKGQQAFFFSMDVARKIGLNVEGYITYPYSQDKIGTALSIDKSFYRTNTGGLDLQDMAAGVMAKYQFKRFGDLYWINGKTTVLSIEDTRGGFGITTAANQVRTSLDADSLLNFIVFLRSLYGTIDNLNAAWGSKYSSFYDIKIGDSKGVQLSKWTAATADYDAFCTYRRALNYKTLLNEAADTIPNAKLDLRLEGSHWICKIDPSSTNQNYRFVLANQYQNALIPEILGISETIYCFSDYVWEAFTPSEVAYMTRSSYEDYGIVSAQLPLINRMRDVALNPKYGTDFSSQFNIKGENTLAVQINTTVSLYEWWKATYENHGVPGVMWSDFTCDGIATATIRREIEFFVSKLKETIATPEGQQWATQFEHDDSVKNGLSGTYSFSPSFVQSVIDAYYADKEN